MIAALEARQRAVRETLHALNREQHALAEALTRLRTGEDERVIRARLAADGIAMEESDAAR